MDRTIPDRRLNVGLCWAGGPQHRNDANRSTRFADWLPLLWLPIRLHSLQVGDRADDWKEYEWAVTEGAKREGAQGDFVTPLLGVEDWADTAGVIAGLDLVITVDTAVLHLAGGMGIPVWGLLAAAPDFRWGLVHDRSPWYPSLTLYRQPRAGTWAEVIGRVLTDLEHQCAK